ncbi:Thymidylate kinase [Lasiodiplodia theobromae]|uniref:Thymidylate kinase n=3 Tax=Lasiodiplodia TaxID=66739 RepID=A0A5N5DG51_9PEZI|nr:Thymidylate kinase [Lasiodiplodia theobromae]KAF9633062.1 Thymidylate kinase [Lasiodiplodia theobromae]KAK0663056.1 Thymidylate kinase [Lasiodiplodia hormozganensis]
MRGKLVVFEGLDRAGKTTQCGRLVVRLQEQGHRVHHMRFPDRTTPIGQMINAYLTGASEQEDHVIHLLFSANRWEAAAKIKSLIAEGTTVVIDRYYYSGCVYSAAKDNPSLSLDWARHPEVGLPRPDVVVFLDISPEKAAQRGGFGVEKYENSKMQKRVRELFADIKTLQQEGQDFVTIDAGDTEDEVAKRVEEVVLEVVKKVDEMGSPLRLVESI